MVSIKVVFISDSQSWLFVHNISHIHFHCSPFLPPPSVSPTASGAATAEQKTTNRKMTKVLKDPAAPKRPVSSFFLFGEEERPRAMAELGNISVGEVGKELGRRWAAGTRKK